MQTSSAKVSTKVQTVDASTIDKTEQIQDVRAELAEAKVNTRAVQYRLLRQQQEFRQLQDKLAELKKLQKEGTCPCLSAVEDELMAALHGPFSDCTEAQTSAVSELQPTDFLQVGSSWAVMPNNVLAPRNLLNPFVLRDSLVKLQKTKRNSPRPPRVE